MWALRDPWRNGPCTLYLGAHSNCKATHGKQADAFEGKEITNSVLKDIKSQWCVAEHSP